MKPYKPLTLSLIAGALVLFSRQLMAEDIRVAVASNFKNAITAIAQRFEANTNHTVVLIPGSTGKHYAQIKNGAPYDIFLAADVKRPRLLEQDGIAIPGSRFTYAIGKLVLWSPKAGYVDADGRVLQTGRFRHIAIANPALAPYGQAAYEVMQARSLWEALETRTVRGENVNQAFQFVSSGNAELGFVAYSQLVHQRQAIEGSFWDIPQSLYAPIEQQAVVLEDNETARAFMSFLQSNEALKIINHFGYDTP